VLRGLVTVALPAGGAGHEVLSVTHNTSSQRWEPLAGRRSTALIHRRRPSTPCTRPHHSCRSLPTNRACLRLTTSPPPWENAIRLANLLFGANRAGGSRAERAEVKKAIRSAADAEWWVDEVTRLGDTRHYAKRAFLVLVVIAMLLAMVSVVICERIAPRDALSGHWVRRPRTGPSPRIRPEDTSEWRDQTPRTCSVGKSRRRTDFHMRRTKRGPARKAALTIRLTPDVDLTHI
jgi:hypothetical protein